MSNVGVVASLFMSQQGQDAVRGDGNQRRSDDDTTGLRRAGTAVDGPDVDANFTSGVREEVVGDAFERVDEARQNARFRRVREVRARRRGDGSRLWQVLEGAKRISWSHWSWKWCAVRPNRCFH